MMPQKLHSCSADQTWVRRTVEAGVRWDRSSNCQGMSDDVAAALCCFDLSHVARCWHSQHDHNPARGALFIHADGGVVHAAPAVRVDAEALRAGDERRVRAADRERLAAHRPLRLGAPRRVRQQLAQPVQQANLRGCDTDGGSQVRAFTWARRIQRRGWCSISVGCCPLHIHLARFAAPCTATHSVTGGLLPGYVRQHQTSTVGHPGTHEVEPVLAGVGEAAGLGGLERLLQQRHVAVQLRALCRGACAVYADRV